MKKEIITEYGNYKCNHSLRKVPKFVLQCYMKFLGIEIRKGTSKETLCNFITKYYEYEKKSKESRENRLCGSKFTEKDWNGMKEKFSRI